MNDKILSLIAREISCLPWQVEHTVNLLREGATLPFISRYRKEATGSLDEVRIGQIKTLWEKYAEIQKRKAAILASIEQQGKLTPDLRKSIEETYLRNRLEDIYLPYRPRRRTRAAAAREKGLEALACLIGESSEEDMEQKARDFLNDEVTTVEEALAGARDIVAETVSENIGLREALRHLYRQNGCLEARVVKDKEDTGRKYENYFNFKQNIRRIPSHRLLAILRAETEGILSVKLSPDEASVTDVLRRFYHWSGKEQLRLSVLDAYKRLLHPSLENEILKTCKEKADIEAIKVFSGNLRQLLLSPPIGQKRVLAIDPGFRTGCKIVCLDEQGNLLHNDVIYPHPPQNERSTSMRKLSQLVEAYRIEVIALGNGTAGRETEQFLKKLILPHAVRIYSVSEDGASVYSASAIAREEFPRYDVTVRGAVSIGRRLMDPLSELVKIDPKSLGVGQYQHDVNQNLLKESLDTTVLSCVNYVGVNLNTAGKHLLTYVSGLGPALAQNIVDYRTEHGPFSSRQEIMQVKRMGKKSFEQCAGFLRIPGAENPLDNSAVHPERYALVSRMAADSGLSLPEFIADRKRRKAIRLSSYISRDAGLPTLRDIMEELDKPGRDPRLNIEVMDFDESIHTIEDLRPGMVLPGIVSNITNFGAFVDIGIKQAGLVHVSQICNHYIGSPAEVLQINQHVRVKILSVDLERERIQLSMKGLD